MKKIKKLLLAIVACTLLINSINTNFAINAQSETLKPGEVTQSKTAKWSDYAKGIAEVSFDVIGENAEEPMDIAIIYDNSGSMQMSKTGDYKTSGWYYASTAAKTLAKDLLKNKDNKVALVPFSDVLIDGKTIHKNPSDFFETHDYIYDKNGNPDNEKMKAVYQLYDYVERNIMSLEEFYGLCETKFNITRDQFVEKNNVTNALIPLTNNETTIINAIDSLYPSYAGTTNYEIALKEAQKMLANSTTKQKIIIMISDGRPNTGKDGVEVANEVKKSGVTIYTCGSGLTNTDAAYLQQIASKDNNVPLYIGVDPEDLTNALLAMRKQFDSAAHDAVIKDTINTDYFEYYSDETHQPTVNGVTLSSSDFSVSGDKSAITWNIGNITNKKKTLKFYIKVKDTLLNQDLLDSDSSFLNNSGAYLTNKDANLTYTDINSGESVLTGHEMASPSLDVKTASLTTILYESDKDGNILTSNNEKIVLKTDTISNKALGITYHVKPEKVITVNGVTYKLIEKDNQSKDVTFTETKISETVSFRYVKVPSVTFETTANGKFSDDTTSQKILADIDSMTIPNVPSASAIPPNMYFTGWNTKLNGSGTAFTSTTEVTTDITVYAQYAYYPVNVTFVDEDGTIYNEQKVDYGKDAIAPSDPVKDGYTFLGWDVDYKNVKADLIVTAVWQKNGTTPPITPEDPIVPPITPEEPITPAPIVPVIPVLPATPVIPALPIVPVQPAPPVVQQPATQTPVTRAPQQNTVIGDNNVPLANGKTEDITDNETPLGAGTLKGDDAWALLNLICVIATMLIGLLALVLKHKKEEDEDKETTYEDKQATTYKRRRWTKLGSVVVAIASLIVFILTEDMSLPMIIIDEWTLLMLAITVVQLVFFIVTFSRKKDEKEDTTYANN